MELTDDMLSFALRNETLESILSLTIRRIQTYDWVNSLKFQVYELNTTKYQYNSPQGTIQDQIELGDSKLFFGFAC